MELQPANVAKTAGAFCSGIYVGIAGALMPSILQQSGRLELEQIVRGSSRIAGQSVKPKKARQIAIFRIIGYDHEIAIKAETLMSKPFRPYTSTQSDGIAPGRLVIPAQAGILLGKALLDARFRGHPATASTQMQSAPKASPRGASDRWAFLGREIGRDKRAKQNTGQPIENKQSGEIE